ncbi:MAG: AAA family ATPase [Clostridia bacterium]|nr:AAA family ATPase [Clostridia bacterium]
MIIEELKIGRFAAFENKTFNFTQGINLIEGENESGKSTIAECIRFIFYGNREDDQSQTPRQGYLILSCEKGRFKVERSFAYSGGVPDMRVTITDLQINAPLKGKDPGAMFLGVSADIFERSCFFGQFGQRNVGGQALSCALENMLSTADEQINAEKSAELLEGEIVRLSGERGEEQGSIPQLEQKKALLKERYDRAVEMEADHKRTGESLQENKKKIEGNRAALEECKAQLGHSDALHRLEHIKRAKLAEDALTECRNQLTEAREECARNGFLPDGSYVKQLRSLLEKGRRYEAAIGEKKEEYALLKSEYERTPKPEGGKEGELLEKVATASATVAANKNYLIISVAAAGLLLLMTLLLFIFKVVAAAVVFLLLMLSSCGVAAFFFLRMKKAKEEEQALYASAGAGNREELAKAVEEWARLTERLSGIERQMEECARKRGKAEEERAAVLNDAGLLAERWGEKCTSVSALDSLYTAAAEVHERISSLEDAEKQANVEYAGLRTEYTTEEVKALIERVKAEGSKPPLSPEEYKKVTMKVNFYDQTSRALEERTAKQEAHLLELEGQMEDRHLLYRELTEVEEALANARERLERLKLAKQALLLAVERMRAKILPGIMEEASDFLSGASAGRYTALLTGEDFSLRVIDGKTGKERPIEELSAAMGDLCYIALRISLTSGLYGDEQAMMVFDESFTHLDDLRLASLFMTLARTAEEKGLQIFFMTCRKREAALFEKIARVNRISL